MTNLRHIYIVLLTLFLSSCSGGLENLATISVTKINPGSNHWIKTTIELKKGDVVELWNDMSIETKQKDKVEVNYFIEQYLDGKSQGKMKLNALKTNPTLLESKEMSRGRMIKSFQGKMEVLNITESGKHTFKAALFTTDKKLILNRANLVFKRRND